VNTYGTIVLEDRKIRNLVRNPGLALSISDAGWAQFVAYVSYKAASAGRTVRFINLQFTSPDCSTPGCDNRQHLDLDQRWYSCPKCGLELDRDHNAAGNILLAGMPPTGLPTR
jgi:putative transposase